MGKVFINQDLLKIELSYGEHPGEVNKCWIRYKNPAGETGTFPTAATHNVTAGAYYIIFNVGEFLSTYGTAGNWKFWLKFQLTDGRVIPGEVLRVKIYNEGAE